MDNTYPLVSVIIPTYNRAQYIGEAIESVLAQTYRFVEIIVVDDGSVDNTRKILEAYENKIRYVYQENKGPSIARNLGARLARGQYLAFLDSDDMWHSQKLEIQMDIFSKNKSILALSAIMIDYHEDCMKNAVRFDVYDIRCYHLDELLVKQQMATPTVVILKEFFDSCGGFREDLKLCEDHDLWLRMAERTPLHKVMLPLAYFRQLKNSLSAGDRDKTHNTYLDFMKSIYKARYPKLRRKLLPKFLAVYYYQMSIEYTESDKTGLAINSLVKSWINSPFKLSEICKGRFLRIRRLVVILRNWLRKVLGHSTSGQIIILCSSLDHIKRGVETWSVDTFFTLRRRAPDVHLYKGSGSKRERNEHIISTLKSNSMLAKRIMKFIPKWCWHIGAGSASQLEQTIFSINLLPMLMFKRNIILYTQEAHTAFLIERYINWKIINAKLILAHGTEESFEYINNFDYVQHLAPYHQDEARRNGVKNKMDFTIPNFVDTDRFRPDTEVKMRKELRIPEDAFVVLTVAAIKKTHKRIDYLLEEVAAIKGRDDVYLVIVGGKTPETDELIERGKELLKERVRFLIDFDREKMHKIYVAADIFALCSLKEMMPIALLEALSSGLPCICNRHPVLEWMVSAGGSCVDLSREGTLASAIMEYFDVKKRKEVGLRARLQAVNNFSKEIVTDKMIKMFEDVTNDKR